MHKLPLCLPPPVLQVSVSTGTKKLVAATAFGAISLLFLARRFQRRKGRKNAQWEPAAFEIISPASGGNGKTSFHPAAHSPFSTLAQLPVCDVIRLTCWAAPVFPGTVSRKLQMNDLPLLTSRRSIYQ